jgi:hypothetical protein
MEFPDYNLRLSITNSTSSSYTEIVLANTNHERQKRSFKQRFFFVLFAYIAFLSSFGWRFPGVHAASLLILVILLFRLCSSIDKEVIKVVKNFGIEKSVVCSFNRSRQIFIPAKNIHRIIINEVIYFVSKQKQQRET